MLGYWQLTEIILIFSPQAFYLERATLQQLQVAIESCILSFNNNDVRITTRLSRILYQPPSTNIHVIVTDDVVNVMKDQSAFCIHLLKDNSANQDSFVALLKS